MLNFDQSNQEFYFDKNKISSLEYRSGKNKLNSLVIAKDYLFNYENKNKNFYIFKNFIDRNIAIKLKNYFISKETINSFIDTKDGSFRLFFYLNSPFFYPKFIKSLIMKCMTFKNMIYVHHDFYQSYCMVYGLNPNNFEEVANHQILHSWQSAYWYKNNCKFEKHIDNYGELACFLILSEKRVDYEEGGIEITYKDGTKKDLDVDYNYGDLVFLDQAQVYHEVKEIRHDENQIGRLQIYIPTIPPNYINKVLFYEDYKYKPFFSYKNVSLKEKIIQKTKAILFEKKIHYSRTNPNLKDYQL